MKYLFFVLGINCGLRTHDLLRLTAADLWNPDLTPRRSFSIKASKTNKADETEINESLCEAMRVAELVLFPHGFDPDKLLFSVRRETVSRWVKKWCHAIGLDEGNYSAHSLRKTYAYHQWVENGKNEAALIQVSRDLGHASTGDTMRYIGIDRDKIRKSQRKLNL